jgi:hypothetical protein
MPVRAEGVEAEVVGGNDDDIRPVVLRHGSGRSKRAGDARPEEARQQEMQHSLSVNSTW